MLKMLVAVINVVDKVDSIISALAEGGVTGGTVLESSGLHPHIDSDDDTHHFGFLRQFLKPERAPSKTLIFVVDEGKEEFVKNTILDCVGDLSKENLGYIVELDVANASAISK